MKSLSVTNGICAVIVFLLLAGCANTPTVETGLAKFNAKDYSGAYDDFVKCAEKSGDTNCMANAGAAAWNMGDPASALRWLRLAARKGNGWAAEKLTEYGAVQPMKTNPPSQ